jgi:predicted nucleic acid-binding protein
MCNLFFATFPSGTFTRNNRGPTAVGSHNHAASPSRSSGSSSSELSHSARLAKGAGGGSSTYPSASFQNSAIRTVQREINPYRHNGHSAAWEVAVVTRYVIGPDVALRLAQEGAVLSSEHQILAPTLLRSQLLSDLYQAVRRKEMTKRDADDVLNYVRGLRIRLLGDRVLQNVAWKLADQLDWPDTFTAEYVALTQLQADAFITLDVKLAGAVKDLVDTAPIEALSGSPHR